MYLRAVNLLGRTVDSLLSRLAHERFKVLLVVGSAILETRGGHS